MREYSRERGREGSLDACDRPASASGRPLVAETRRGDSMLG